MEYQHHCIGEAQVLRKNNKWIMSFVYQMPEPSESIATRLTSANTAPAHRKACLNDDRRSDKISCAIRRSAFPCSSLVRAIISLNVEIVHNFWRLKHVDPNLGDNRFAASNFPGEFCFHPPKYTSSRCR